MCVFFNRKDKWGMNAYAIRYPIRAKTSRGKEGWKEE